MAKKLTQTIIAQLPVKGQRYSVYDSVIKGLYVTVFASGRKTFNIKYTRPCGKQNCKVIGDCAILSVTQAREKAQTLLAEILLGNDPDKKEQSQQETATLKDLIKIYADAWAGEQQSRKEAIDAMQKRFKEFLDRKPQDLTLLELEQWQQKMRVRKRPLKFVTINRYTSTLKAMLNWAEDRNLIDANTIKKLKKLKETDSKEITRYLTDEERQRLLDALDKRERDVKEARRRSRLHADKQYLSDLQDAHFVDSFKPLVIIALNTGIRRKELFSLRWEDIDFNAGTILLRAANAKTKKTLIIPMNDIVSMTLKLWQEQTGKERGLIFPNPLTGKPYTNCDSSWNALLKEAKIENYRWHDMRHDFASRLVMKGVDLNTVRELLGHSDLKMTMRYAHLAPEKKQTAVNMLN